MDNFISLNIRYLMGKERTTQKEFGEIFGLKQNVISSYIKETAIPKLDTIQQICNYFQISIDDFVNNRLELIEDKPKASYLNALQEPVAPRGNEAHMQKIIDTQERMIELLEAEVRRLKGGQEYNGQTA